MCTGLPALILMSNWGDLIKKKDPAQPHFNGCGPNESALHLRSMMLGQASRRGLVKCNWSVKRATPHRERDPAPVWYAHGYSHHPAGKTPVASRSPRNIALSIVGRAEVQQQSQRDGEVKFPRQTANQGERPEFCCALSVECEMGDEDGSFDEFGDAEVPKWRWRLHEKPMMWFVDEEESLLLDRLESVMLWQKQAELDAEWLALESAADPTGRRVTFSEIVATVHEYPRWLGEDSSSDQERDPPMPPAPPSGVEDQGSQYEAPRVTRHSAFSVYRTENMEALQAASNGTLSPAAAMKIVARQFADLKKENSAVFAEYAARAAALNEAASSQVSADTR